MTRLQDIQDTARHVAVAISAALGVEVALRVMDI